MTLICSFCGLPLPRGEELVYEILACPATEYTKLTFWRCAHIDCLPAYRTVLYLQRLAIVEGRLCSYDEAHAYRTRYRKHYLR